MNKVLLVLLIILISFSSFSQTTELPMGFRDIVIGLDIDDAKIEIENDGYFNYQGDPDVSMLLSENRSIIETKGNFYIENAYFQFYNETLYTITLVLDPSEIDYHSMYTKLKNKYGKYNTLSPTRVVWENEVVRISLEKPLTIKYVGLGIYNTLVEEDTTEKAIQEQLREDFIDAF